MFLKVDLRSAVTRLSLSIKVRVQKYTILISLGDCESIRSTLNFENGGSGWRLMDDLVVGLWFEGCDLHDLAGDVDWDWFLVPSVVGS